MGSRAVIGILEHGQLRRWYDHWLANRLPEELLPGWDYFQHRADTGYPINDWLDIRWDEGSVLIDRDRRVMLVYGGEEASYDPGYRRAVVDLLGITWPGYRIHWCYEQVLDIADYLGLPRATYAMDRAAEYPRHVDPADFSRSDWDPATYVVTVVSSGRPVGPMVHAVVETADWEDFLAGPAVWREVIRLAPYRLEPWYTPATGAHFDFEAKQMTVWSHWEGAGIREALASRWHGWRIDYTGDDPTRHELLSGLQLRRPEDFASTRYAEVITTAATRLVHAHPPDIVGMTQALGVQGDLNPHVHHTSVPTPSLVAVALENLRLLWEVVLPNHKRPDVLA